MTTVVIIILIVGALMLWRISKLHQRNEQIARELDGVAIHALAMDIHAYLVYVAPRHETTDAALVQLYSEKSAADLGRAILHLHSNGTITTLAIQGTTVHRLTRTPSLP